MTMKTKLRLCLLLAPLLTQAPCAAEGEGIEFALQTQPTNALGIASLSQLRGRPVLVAYWNSQTWADDWVRDVVGWQREYGEDLAVIFAELLGNTDEQIESIALRKKWLGTRAIWMHEYPVDTGLTNVPSYALLDAQGRLIAKGQAETMGMNFPNRELEEIERAIGAQVRLRREGPAQAPEALRGVYRSFAKGELDQALEALDGLLESEDDAVRTAARAAATDFERRVAQRLDRARALLDEARLVELERELEPLLGQLARRPELEQRRARLEDELKSEALAGELEACRALAKLEQKIFAKGPKPSLKYLERLAKKYAGTRNAERALRYVRLANMR